MFRHVVASLCVVLAVSSGIWIVVQSVYHDRDKGARSGAGLDAPQASLWNTEPSRRPLSDDQVVVYFFHGNVRCRACRRIEQYSRQVVERDFARSLEQGTLAWRPANYERPEMREAAVRYGVIAPTVVLVVRRNGRELKVKNLMTLWDLTEDQAAFEKWLRKKISEVL